MILSLIIPTQVIIYQIYQLNINFHLIIAWFQSFQLVLDHLGDTMVNALASNLVRSLDRGLIHGRPELKTIEFVYLQCVSSLGTPYKRVNAKILVVLVSILCPSWAKRPPILTDCCLSEHGLNPAKHAGVGQSWHNHHYLMKSNIFSPWYSCNISHLT